MADQITLDVLDRPAGGTFRALRELCPPGRRTPGLRGVVRLRTNRFVAGYQPNLTPRRIALLGVWLGTADVERGWREALGDACAAGREHWHVRGELVRSAFTHPWRGWTPDTDRARPLGDDDPALVLISGALRAGAVPAFVRDAVGAVAHAFDHPGYLGGLGLQSSPLNTTSCSAWRTYADAKDYAFARGGRHSEAMKRDRANGNHVTEHFIRIRPVASSGTLAGRPVFDLG